ncbi:MAG: DUF975 family protein, partial [Clostridiales Family XIII bacterium]|nr:DUF975 family protein [Clostridiales Family XIII bacterium]
MWNIGAVKREGRRSLGRNYFVCFIASLVLLFVVNGPLSISETVNMNLSVLKSVAAQMQGSVTTDALNRFVAGAEKFKKSTSLGMDAKKGTISSAYRKLASANGVHGLIAAAVDRHIARGKLDSNAILLVSLLALLLIYVFVGGIIEVGLARVFLESRTTPDTRVNRLFFIYGVGRTRGVALIILMRTAFLILWAFTIVGFPIKYYSYRFVPYILAENPDVGRKEVFALSSRLTRGHRMRMFLFDLSFVPWKLLSIATLGILDYVWVNPYYNAAKAEIYASVRGGDLSLCEIRYRRLPERFTGILSHIGAKPQYSFINLSLMFLLFSFMGWVFECSLWIIEQGILVNRGTMYGPWIPIYGIGGLVIITVVNRFYRKPLVCFFMVIAVCAPIEYAGGW